MLETASNLYISAVLLIGCKDLEYIVCSSTIPNQLHTYLKSQRLENQIWLHKEVGSIVRHSAPSDLQPHYGNRIFGNVYLLALYIKGSLGKATCSIHSIFAPDRPGRKQM